MAMGMDYAWHRGRAESTESNHVSAQDASEGIAGPERPSGVQRHLTGGNQWRSLYLLSRATIAQQRVACEGLRHTIRMRGKTIQRLQNRLRRLHRKLKWWGERFCRRLAAVKESHSANVEVMGEEIARLHTEAAGLLERLSAEEADHASWRRDAEAEYESVRQKLHDHFLLPHLEAIDMAAALAKVRPVGGPPFDLAEGVRQVVHELLHMRAENAGLRQTLADERERPDPGVIRIRIAWDPEREDSEETRQAMAATFVQAFAQTMADFRALGVEAERDRMRARLESLSTGIVNECSQDDIQEFQCDDCGEYASTADEIRHVAGTRIGERACPYMLTARALGRIVLDDSEGAA